MSSITITFMGNTSPVVAGGITAARAGMTTALRGWISAGADTGSGEPIFRELAETLLKKNLY